MPSRLGELLQGQGATEDLVAAGQPDTGGVISPGEMEQLSFGSEPNRTPWMTSEQKRQQDEQNKQRILDAVQQASDAAESIVQKGMTAKDVPEQGSLSRKRGFAYGTALPGAVGQFLSYPLPPEASPAERLERAVQHIAQSGLNPDEQGQARQTLTHQYILDRIGEAQGLIQGQANLRKATEDVAAQRETFGGKTWRRWERGTASMIGGIWHLVEEVQRLATLGEYGDTAEEQARMYHDVLAEPEMQPVVDNYFDRFIGGTVESGPFLAASLGPVLLGGGAPALAGGLLMTYAIAGNDVYQSSLDRGMSEAEARTRGVVAGLADGILMMVGGRGTKPLKDMIVDQTLTTLGKTKAVSIQAINNATRLTFQQLAPQEAVSMTVGGNLPLNEDGTVDWGSLVDRAVDTVVIGTLSGMAMDAGMMGARRATAAKPKPEPAKPAPVLDEATLKASRYDYLLDKAMQGDQQALKDLTEQTPGRPTYDELLTKAQAGDQEAVAQIQAGQYRQEPGAPGTKPPPEIGPETARPGGAISTEEYNAIVAKRKTSGKLKGGRQAGGTIMFDPGEWGDLVKVGRYHLEQGAKDFAAWSKKVMGDLGDGARPYLVDLWKDVSQGQEPGQGQAAAGQSIPGGTTTTPKGEIAPPGASDFVTAIAAAAKAVLPETRKAARVVQAEQSAARGQRVAVANEALRRGLSSGMRAEDALGASTKALAGEQAGYKEVFPAIRGMVAPEVIDQAFAKVATDRGLLYFEKLDLKNAFGKFIDGNYITLREAALIERYFGPELGQSARNQVPWHARAWETFTEIVNLPRSLLTGGDISHLMRQSRLLWQRYPEMAGPVGKKSIEAFVSKDAAEAIRQEIRRSPFYSEAVADGLDLTEAGLVSSEVGSREEAFTSMGLINRAYYKGGKLSKFVFPWIASERSFVNTLNWARLTAYAKARAAIEDQTGPMSAVDRGKLAQSINDLSGRSKLPGYDAMRNIAALLNAAFAPRFAVSRIKVPIKAIGSVPASLIEGKPTVNLKTTAASLASLVGTNLALMFLLKVAFPDDKDVQIEPDLRSSDGGKIQVGDTRFDLWAGLLQPARLAVQLASGQTKTAADKVVDVDRGELIGRFLRSKADPVTGLVIDALSGSNYIGQGFGAPPEGPVGEKLTKMGVPDWVQGVSKEAWNRLVLLTVQDAADALVDEGVPQALAVFAATTTGVSVQTYPDKATTQLTKSKDEAARADYGKPFEELSPDQQKEVAGRPEIADLHRQAQVERARTGDIFLSEQSQEKMSQARREFVENLPTDVTAEFDRLKFNFPMFSTKLGQYQLNDDRYARYQELTKEILLTEGVRPSVRSPIAPPLSDLFLSDQWTGLNDDEQRQLLVKIISAAKREAGRRLKEEAND